MSHATPSTDDPLDELRRRVHATQEAAERLHAEAEAARAAEAAGEVPPAGWASAQERASRADEVSALASLLRALRDLLPDELQAQVTEVLRQLLLLVRAILDWWVARLEPGAAPGGLGASRPAAASDVEDIPIG
ncbi:hypothetical protein SK069_15905 [Patulibacter brassicae]|jgi:hypothetical protein|uniref:Uncharacterized protein n=1 Tax=Patulibacter brassicae TaxID=1705717 RepID=A0ABU4VMM3_9ACTN|nr:hypothetical protein [Patulibacter brassicae]MDX8153084.1 hypothetical protein [Patulibacter brassicae]